MRNSLCLTSPQDTLVSLLLFSRAFCKFSNSGTGQTRRRWDVVEAGRWRVGLHCALASQGEGGGGQRRSLSLAHVTGGAGQKLGGGSGACFAFVAWLALVGDGGVLGVVHWQGMSGRQRWRVGEAMALSQCWRRHTDVRGDGT